MNTDFGFIGWCYDEKENHDKIWGHFYRPTEAKDSKGLQSFPSRNEGWNVVIFYARRGRAIQFKADATGRPLRKLTQSKINKGYEKITANRLLEIWPSFEKECMEKLAWDVLAGRIK